MAEPLPGPIPAEVSGRASVIDGDTLEIRGQRIRLHGIDAPESRQLCTVDSGPYRCGQQAALALADRIGQKPITCQVRDTDRYKRLVAVCRLAGEDLNRWMVRKGHALAYRKYSADYVADEDGARAEGKGIWRSRFDPPWEWRKGRR